MSDNTIIKTTKTIYPQLYAYTIPGYERNDGWIKIGYTERKHVDERIRQQTHTVGVRYEKLWSGPAQFYESGDWFTDKHFHRYLRISKEIEQRPSTEWFYYDGTPGQSYTDFEEYRNNPENQVKQTLEYTLRAEQEEAVQATLAYASTHSGGEFLWNAKPRFGKTLTAYDFARRLDAQRVLIVTNRPAIANSWYDDFDTFIAWQTNYIFVSTADSLKERPVLTRKRYDNILKQLKPEDEIPGCIAFVSLQDLKGAISFGGTFDKLSWITGLEWDLLVIDEAHEGVDTFKTDVAFNNITRNFTLHLSGTPFKAVASGKFSADQIFNWTYSDEQEAKATWPDDNEEANPYEGLPRLNLFSYQMSQMITDEVNKGARIGGEDVDFAFDLNEFFATNDSGVFIHEAEVKKWLDTLTRNEKYPFSTPALRAELKHSFWLLNRVASARALHKLLKDHPVFENYEIVLAAGDGRTEDDPIVNQQSLDRVREAIRTHDRTITLSVGQLTTGVTVPEWTAVLMLSNVQSPSLYMQAAFRAQNQWSFDVEGEKRRKQNAYVFDFAPERTLIIYDNFANNLDTKTADAGGTSEDRKKNIKKLLNFFPVIAEDDDGTMIELDVQQVLTIPKTIKAKEVVRLGFMSNLLFQNISGIFASSEVREILEQLNPVPQGKTTPRKDSSSINTQNIEVDDEGNAIVDQTIVINTTEARFGDKIYGDLVESAKQAADSSSTNLTNVIASTFIREVLDTAKAIAKENTVTVVQAEQIVRQNANILAREVELVQKQAEIEHRQAVIEYEKEVAESSHNEETSDDTKARYEARQQEIADKMHQAIANTVQEKSKELIQKSTNEILQKSEEKKKTTVENDVRDRLRGFARTIPSFLMAYGEPSTRLSNFDSAISDEVFVEVTGITLDQFRLLRDAHKFFDEVVFDESVQEFLHKKNELANYFDDEQTEDIFDYIPPQHTNQIFTPKWVVKMMIDMLEEENPDLFTDETRTFADLYVKSGLYLTEVVKRLYKGLEDVIPDEGERLKHILENQINGFAPSEIIYNIAKNYIYGAYADIDSSRLHCLDLTETAKRGATLDMKFDVVVGNPPYQENQDYKNNYSEPIYPHFYELAERLSEKYCLISPARFLFNVGATRGKWNKKMLNDPHLKVVYYNQNSADVFPTTDITGGVAVLCYDSTKHFGAIKTFTTFNELNTILHKISLVKTINQIEFGDMIHVQTKFNLQNLYLDFPHFENRLGGDGRDRRLRQAVFTTLPEIFFDEKHSDEDVQIYGRINNNRIYKWINSKYLDIENSNFKKFKVIVPAANGSGAIGEVSSTPVIGYPVIGHPEVGYTQTYISFGSFDNEFEAQALLKYIKTKFLRTMLGIKKITQDNKSKDVWAEVPIQDFTPQSDIDWKKSIAEIDFQFYKKYSLNESEVSFIEEKVRSMV